ncbi:phosphonate C-P lyase system protein PhnH [Aquabacter sediminis]|uniref:phosphonate C-P lyase system protein PhnH n=1 Tax=Aquabacter sediminis TaxID=3029197 RepID=UPI00237D48C5|nr:phosphonate C-P lyase system protein PhnH [Aquabacter sp. P-9]MDE1570779.1 phosphonate C-P lyase system protein PhnH [Aquabacter sp. P-9]
MAATALAAGFSDPSRDAQRTFKAVMWALAQPGTPQKLATDLTPPAPLTPELAAIALALLDYETPVWLDPALRDAPGVADFLRFHTGAPVVADTAAARFALIASGANLPDFSRFAQGEPDYPDRSATLIVGVEDAGPDGAGVRLRLEGPGIDGTARLGAAPLPEDMADRLRENRAAFPLGIDLLLVARGIVVGLPRSVRAGAEE